LVAEGVRALQGLLPDKWSSVRVLESAGGERRHGGELMDALVHVGAPGGQGATLLVEAKSGVAPRDVELVVGRLRRAADQRDRTAGVVFAPWLSARTRSLLDGAGVGYLDLTGNVHLRLAEPALFIRVSGAERDPAPVRRASLSLRGPGAGRVVRFLVDVAPPYTASSVAEFSGVSVPYVSRLLSMLDREALVERGERGLVVGVDWQNLLRVRAESYQVFGTNEAHGFISGQGVREVVARLLADPATIYRAVTGSFAAAQRAPIAATSQLAVYVEDPGATAQALGLLPTDEGADVVLLTPYDYIVVDRAKFQEGVWVAAPSQVVLDCLTGSGRMPAEGQALLEWMGAEEGRWRRKNTDGMERRGQVYR